MNAQDREAQLAQIIANLLYARDDAPVYQLHHRAAQAAVAAADADLRARLAAAEAREARLVAALQRAQADVRGGIPTATGGWWNSPAAWDASRRIDAALTTDGSALAQAIEGVLDGPPRDHHNALAALRAAWRGA